MIQVASSELSEFIKRSRSIKSNGILPITDYIKIDVDGDALTLSKTNNAAFCVHEINVMTTTDEEKSFLIDEQTLVAMLSGGHDLFVELSHKKGKTKIVRGEMKDDSQVPEASLFPAIQAYDRDAAQEIPADMLESIGLARGYVKTGMEHNSMFVHVRKTKNHSYVCGSDGQVLYYKSFPGVKVGDLMLLPEAAAQLMVFENVAFAKCGNYDIFDCGKTIYGFIQTVMQPIDFEQFLTLFTTENIYTVNRKAILEACSYVAKVHPGNLAAEVKMRPSGREAVMLEYNNAEIDKNFQRKIAVKAPGEIVGFNFNPKLMIADLQELQYDEINFSQSDAKWMYLSSDEDKAWRGLLMGLYTPPGDDEPKNKK